jgi:CheY-like chemotaxis protein
MMDDPVSDIDFRPRPTAERPLLGLTILVVEDSRYSSEALRLLCLRSGARIRRADCLCSAERHLNVYRPSVAIVDLGLPDGSGLDLIARMDDMRPRVPIILGTSGNERHIAARRSVDAGADGFLAKPIESIAEFQAAILAHMPAELQPKGPRDVVRAGVEPDPITYREDLSHAMDLLALDSPPVGYLRRFLIGVARSAHDCSLEGRAQTLRDSDLPAAQQADLRYFLSSRIQDVPMTV